MKDAKCVIEELELLKKFCEENIAEAKTVSVCRVFEGCRVAVVDALKLIEEQDERIAIMIEGRETVKPTLIREGRNKHCNDYVCPRCGNEVVYEQNYCSECGVQFLWEGR